jgi:hypothetical protein
MDQDPWNKNGVKKRSFSAQIFFFAKSELYYIQFYLRNENLAKIME